MSAKDTNLGFSDGGVGEEGRAELERKAERARAHLLTAIDTLEQRGHDVLDVRHQVEEHIVPVVSVGAVLVVVAGSGLGFAAYRAIDARRHRGRDRIRALVQLWRNPQRAMRYAPRSMFAELGRKVLFAGLSMLAVEITKRIVKEVVPVALSEDDIHARPTPSGLLVSQR